MVPKRPAVRLVLFLVLDIFILPLLASGGADPIPLFDDTGFLRGFDLGYPSSAKGRAVEKVLSPTGSDAPAPAPPAWRLCQWATRISLAAAEPVRLPGGGTAWEDETKRVVIAGRHHDPLLPDLVLDLRAGEEYRGRSRRAGEDWPHLLIEQDARRVVTLDRLDRLDLDVSVRLARFADHMEGKADPSLHAAQLQLFLIVKEVAPGARGDFFWFGVPFFDSRHEFPPPFRARDGGKADATGKYIFTVSGREVLPASLRSGSWVRVRKDLLPAIVEGISSAVEEKFLERKEPGRYAIVNMNLGWEMPGAYDGAAEVRGLSVTAVPRKEGNPDGR